MPGTSAPAHPFLLPSYRGVVVALLSRVSWLALIALSLTCLLGCGSGSQERTSTVSGTVKLNGEPLAAGTITFESPEDLKVGRASAAAEIKNGHYELKSTPGQKTVRISAPEEFGKPDETGTRNTRELLPAKYNANSTLKKNVTAEGPNQFDFELKSK